jgi:hypothetical protein
LTIDVFQSDLVGIAGEIARRAGTDPAGALARLDGAFADLSPELRRALEGRLDSRLTPAERAALSREPEGRALVLAWAAERSRAPVMPRLPFFSPRQGYAWCASLVSRRGDARARDALRKNRLVLLGLRHESDALSNKGRGVYDDWIAVLNGRGGLRGAHFFPACTEPGAQYAARSRPGAEGKPLDARYAGIKFRKSEGFDVDKDGVADIGRLAQGTYVFEEKPDGYLKARAFRPVMVETAERDTNGDGWFTPADRSRIDTERAGKSMLIHHGGPANAAVVNTWSAGCQTIPDDHYRAFLALMGRPTPFPYVLVNTR